MTLSRGCASPGKWNGFGGKVEKGESIEQAAMRELLEESRLKTQSVEKKGRLIFTLDTEPEILVSERNQEFVDQEP